MKLRVTFAALSMLALTACGQEPQPAEQPAATLPPAATGPTAEEIAAKVATLPAPYNTGDYANGRKLFAQCRSCHTIDAGGGNRVGPNLHGLFGRAAGTAEGFPYSDAVKNSGIVWDGPKLDEWLANPKGFLPGNRMTFLGIKDETARRDVITYLKVESSD